ncbi:MAG: carboxylating nicotinate-nucleotide diphosphorylase [Hamadaea sp.]|nr:carboxylating nicotinate-nucleotide diphosphorylase [Hamadaea sp.]
MREQTARALRAQGMDPAEVQRIVQTALLEDLGPRWLDVTSASTIPAEQVDTADIVARASGVVAGLHVAASVFEEVEVTRSVQLDAQRARTGLDRNDDSAAESSAARTTVELISRDGARVARGDLLATVTGPTRVLLMAERTALNLLSRMSGVATHTRAWADELEGTKATVLDTRKTTPGLRILEKYAVRAGGGTNKRMGLYDVAMIKDNHKLAAGSVTAAYERVRETFPEVAVQVEVTTLAEAVEATEAGADFLLLDNMTPELLREIVAEVGGRVELEATGGLTLEVAREYAETGVDYLSVGGLTHSSPIVDIALDLRPRG